MQIDDYYGTTIYETNYFQDILTGVFTISSRTRQFITGTCIDILETKKQHFHIKTIITDSQQLTNFYKSIDYI